ncbi:hypothetical protein KOR42_35390 [Thalassoglobus neptunius]|uniref:Uncharacterized protein n=1 Tax=Thalassoglobus neptunius TaxID=1938619 RepID=A0A5C5WN14_9PLAN|nr:DUF5682 family protein [Thalassoglobus neptunius]TWT51491.1 hypothetical protein KOR42_35390 [Thalassoglobus neptunius]
MNRIQVFGIRHHGPGCARSLLSAFQEWAPDVVLMEGPADAEPSLELIQTGEVVPPVAMLVYPKQQPRRSVSYPLAVFSPEWQALNWANEHSVPVHLIDLPMSHRLALDEAEATPEQVTEEQERQDDKTAENAPVWRADPIAILSNAAGYSDPELWWEEQIERRQDPRQLFEAIQEAMRSVRDEFPETREADLLREAFMRRSIRRVVKEDFQRIAIVCGAWHGPVLDEAALKGKVPGCRVKDDQARLKGLPKLKTTSTWIPWTYSRLAYRSGYGAGIQSPGWYEHVWTFGEQAPQSWLTNAARLLRKKEFDAAPANIVEALRLAETLAALRERPSAGLAELNESILAVLCHGNTAPLQLIREELEIGDRLGSVPVETPTVPLAEDLARLQKSLRIKPSVEKKVLDLDLRKPIGLQRSQLLNRLNILGISWGILQQSGGGISTFHELWELQWHPQFAVELIEANVWGTTVESAASARILDLARSASTLSALTQSLDAAILADLQESIPGLIELIRSKSAVGSDVVHLMEAVGPLANISRYSDVRGTQCSAVLPLLKEMLSRILIGLPSACQSTDDDAAEAVQQGILSTQAALDLIQDDELTEEWNQRLSRIMNSKAHGLLRGSACRLLIERKIINTEELNQITSLELSPVTPTLTAANWLTGLLQGNGLVLLHMDDLWKSLDHWLMHLNEEIFDELLPILRRAFSDFTGPERRQMAEKIRTFDLKAASRNSSNSLSTEKPIHSERARLVIPILSEILGVNND